MIKKFFSLLFLDKEIKEDVAFLKNIDVFKMFSISQLKKITTLLYRRTYLKNETIYNKNEPAELICLLKTGKVELSEENNKTFIYPDTKFGEKYLLSRREKYLNTAKAAEDSEIYLIHKEDLESVMQEDSSIGFKIASRLLQILYNKE